MPLRNRVNPTGQLIAVTARGTLMGNRGLLHNDDKEIVRESARTAWIYCALEFQGRRQQIMAPGKYTQLFFLDGATALAAGHRPCARCLRPRYNEYMASLHTIYSSLTVAEVDSILRNERSKPSADIVISELPDGSMVSRPGRDGDWLIWQQKLHLWSPSGYSKSEAITMTEIVTPLTPELNIQALSAGYLPEVYPTAGSDQVRSGSFEPASSRDKLSISAPLEGPEFVMDTSLTQPPKEITGPKYKLAKTPSGKELYAYFAAILSETGMDQGLAYNLKKLMSNFSGHESAGRIEKLAPGSYQLSAKGKEYFSSRYEIGSRQYIDPVLLAHYKKGLNAGGKEWIDIR